ncbi:nitroreductase family protein [Bradyrhizobium sp. 168]|uniref:nitroreductase family protein n=1 Tax=Bradyrhizobium sp. 168 TaxID=2782639 RepID=UPI0020970152|nr:nitroreductase family protein [Bradyrhizobium sp. 168]
MIGPSEECGAAQSPIDEIMTRRIACRDFCDAPVPRRAIEQILHVARFAPSGANIQPWHVYVLSGAAKASVSAALLNAHETCRDEHVSEYKYYASELPDPYLKRRQNSGGCSTGRWESARPMPRQEAGGPRRITRFSEPPWD